jgi:hypothetical protein
LLKGRLRGGIGVMVARTRNLWTHPEAFQVVMAPLRGYLVSPGLLADPASNRGTRPQATTWRWSLHRLGQLLQLLGREQPRTARRPGSQAAIPDALGSLEVVAMHDAPSIGWVQADELGGIRDRLAVGNERKELPAAGFHQVGGVPSPPAQLSGREMGMEGEGACHAAAYHSSLTSCGFRIRHYSL